MSKKVLQLCISDSWGGLEMSAVNYARLLNANGVESFCLATENSPLANKARSSGIEVHNLKANSGFFEKTNAIRKIIREEGVDTVFVHRLRDLKPLWPALLGMPNVRVIGFAHMLLQSSKRDPIHSLLYSRLEKLVAFTHRQRDLLLPKLPLPADKYAVAYPGVDSNRFHPTKRDEALRSSLGAAPTDCLVGVVGRFDRQKGQLEFVQALKIISEKNVPFKAVMVGAPTIGENQNNYDKEIFDYIKEHSLEHKIKFSGFIEDPSKLMASLDLFVLPSHQETFGLVVLEAMASGTAVIATDAGGPPEILDEKSALFAPKSPQSLANALEKFITSASERRTLGSQLRERACKSFSEFSFTETLLKLAVSAT